MAFEALVGRDIGTYVNLSKLEYIGSTFIPYFWLRFALQNNGDEQPLSLGIQAALLIIPVLTIIFAFTNEHHGLIWASPHFTIVANSPVFEPTYGLWFWLYFIYSYTIFLIGSITLIRYAKNTWRVYRSQALLVLVGTAIPWIGNLLQIFDPINPVPYLYLNPILGVICTLCLSFGLFRLRLLDVTPIAYETILNNIPAGILVVDLHNRILAVNNSVNQIFNCPKDLIGQQLNLALPHCGSELLRIQCSSDHKGQFNVNDHIYEVTASTAYTHNGSKRGVLFAFSDITATAQAARVQQVDREFSEMINRLGSTLNMSLNVNIITSSILDSLEQLIPNSRLNIMLIDDDGYTTRIHQHRGYESGIETLQQDVVFDYRISPILTESVVASAPHTMSNVRTNNDLNRQHLNKSNDAFATISIIADNKPIGFINIDCLRPNVFTPELTNRLQIFGQQAALAIKNAQLYEQTRQQAEELKSRISSMMITQQVYKDIGYSIDSDTLLQLILDAALRISRADVGYVALMRDNSLHLANSYGNYNLAHLENILTNKSGIINQTIAGKHILVMQVPNPLESAYDEVSAQIALPIFTVDTNGVEHLYGVVVLETKNPSRFTEDRLQLLELICDRAAIALQNVELVNRVRDRADELEILYAKVSYLEKFKTDMIRVAAHDLKNPLGVIRNYLTMLIDSPELELDLDKVYPSMLRSAERMLQIVQNFLSMDRIEKAAKLQTMAPFDLSAVVQSALEEFMPRASQKEQWVDVLLPHEACIVRGDSAQIYEAVSNFISNAIKYTPNNGHIAVILEAYKDYAQLEITDNGFGIPEENQANLFQPFYRSQTAETSSIEGTGLGLHLTKTIIEQQDGEIIFSSIYHQGSTFGFKIPIYHEKSTITPTSPAS